MLAIFLAVFAALIAFSILRGLLRSKTVQALFFIGLIITAVRSLLGIQPSPDPPPTPPPFTVKMPDIGPPGASQTVAALPAPAPNTPDPAAAPPARTPGMDALLTKVENAEVAAELAVLCGIRSMAWRGVIDTEMHRRIEKTGFELDAEVETLMNYLGAHERTQACAELRKDYSRELSENDALVRRLRPHGFLADDGFSTGAAR